MTLIIVDIEAVGPTPITGEMTEFGAVEFDTKKTFYGQIYATSPSPDNPAIPVIEHRVAELCDVMEGFVRWILEVSDSRPTFVSDNPAYDFMWIATAFDACGLGNPFGHSARRIGDFYAGLRRNFFSRQDWKKLRKTRHNHHPVNDAMGNVEALHRLFEGELWKE